jgi:addiction module HigA family antidote
LPAASWTSGLRHSFAKLLGQAFRCREERRRALPRNSSVENIYAIDSPENIWGKAMLTTIRQPVSVGEMLVEEFMQPIGLTQAALAEAMGVPRKHVNELCNNRRSMTAATALILARVFGNSPDFWLNTQQRNDLWQVLNTTAGRELVERAKPLNLEPSK